MGPAEIKARRSETIVVKGFARSPGCGGATRRLHAEWTLVEGDLDMSRVPIGADPRTLTLPSQLGLTVGMSYRFRFTASLEDEKSVSNSVVLTIIVISQPLVALIAGGSRAVGADTAFTLDASSSLDPDASALPFIFTWSCHSGNQPCTNVITQQPLELGLSARITIPGHSLASGLYRFTVIVRKSDERTSSASVDITVLQGAPPQVSISPLQSKANPSVRLVLSGSVNSQYGVSNLQLQWSQIAGDLNFVPSSGTLATPITLNTLVIRSRVLTPGGEYTFRLSATDPTGTRGYADIKVIVNAPPRGGYILAEPSQGVVLATKFAINCLDWADDPEDLPLQYTYKYKMGGVDSREQELILASALQTNRLRDIVLPQGSEPNFMLTLIADISDRLGATVQSHSLIAVYPANVSDNEMANYLKNQTDTLLAVSLTEGDTTGTLQIASAAGNTLNIAREEEEEVEEIYHEKEIIWPLLQCLGSHGPFNITSGERSVVCSGHGHCVRLPLEPCSVFGSYNPWQHKRLCTAQCICENGWGSNGCRLDKIEIENRASLRDTLVDAVITASETIELTLELQSQQAEMTEVLTSNPEQLFGDTQDKVLGFVSSLVKPKSEVPNTILSSTSSAVGGTLSSLVDAGVMDGNPVDGNTTLGSLYCLNDTSIPENEENSTNANSTTCSQVQLPRSAVVAKVIAQTLSDLSRSQLANAVAGEDATILISKNLQMASKRAPSSDLQSSPIGIPPPPGKNISSMFELPSLDSLFGNTTGFESELQSIDLSGVQWTKNPHAWRGQNVSSYTTSLTLRNANGSEVAVTNASQPIRFFLPHVVDLQPDDPIEEYIVLCPLTIRIPQNDHCFDRETSKSRRIKEKNSIRGGEKILLKESPIAASHWKRIVEEVDESESSSDVLNNTQIGVAPRVHVICNNGLQLTHQCDSSNLVLGSSNHNESTCLIVEEAYNVTFRCPRVVTKGACMYWDEENLEWSSRGCQVVDVTESGTLCECTHLTDFASQLSLVTEDAKLVFSTGKKLLTEPLFLLSQFSQNWIIFGTLILVCGIVIIFCCAGRRADLIDILSKIENTRINRRVRHSSIAELMLSKEDKQGEQRNRSVSNDINSRNRDHLLGVVSQSIGQGPLLKKWWRGIQKGHKYISVLYQYDIVFTRPKRVAVLGCIILVSKFFFFHSFLFYIGLCRL